MSVENQDTEAGKPEKLSLLQRMTRSLVDKACKLPDLFTNSNMEEIVGRGEEDKLSRL